MAPTTGETIAERYRLDGRLGEGGMGIVYAATHTVTRKRVALKVLRADYAADSNTRQRFLREARAASAVRHPNVVQIHDVLELPGGVPAMVMELLEGETLAHKLDRDGPLDVGALVQFMLPVLSAVGTAHALGIVHRDLKPENIFLARTHDGRVDVKVLDFGIAKLTATEGDAARSGGLTGTGSMLGTPFYMSPEQSFGEPDIDHRADIWSLGVIFYECLAGERPTQAENIGQILKIVMTDAIVPLSQRVPGLPPEVTRLVGRMLQRERSARPADLRELVEILVPFAPAPEVPSFGAPRTPLTPSMLPSHSPRASTFDSGPGADGAPESAGYDDTVEEPPSRAARDVAVTAGALSRPTGGGGRQRRPAYLAVASVVAVAAAVGFWRIRSDSPTPPSSPAAASTPDVPHVASAALVSTTPASASSTSAPVATASATASSVASAAPAPSVSPSASRASLRPGVGVPAAAVASSRHPSISAPTTPSTTPAKTSLDPGSYQ